MKTRFLIAASVLALSMSGYALADTSTNTTTQSGQSATTTQMPAPGTNTNSQSGASTDLTQTGQSTTQTNDQMKTGQSGSTDATTTTTTQPSTATTTTTTDQNQAAKSTTQTNATAMSSDILVPADQLSSSDKIWMANDFIGKTVYSQNNENVGDINDVIFSKDGKIVGVVLGVGGFLGIGEKNVVVKLDAIQMTNTGSNNNTADNSNMQLVVATTKDALEAAPSFDRKTRSYVTDQGTTTSTTTTTTQPATGTETTNP